MPKSKLADAARKASEPPIDWLKAAILERSSVFGLNQKDLAQEAHVSYGVFRKYMMRSPWEWPDDIRNSVCKRLGINAVRTVEGAPNDDWREKR